MSIGQNSSEKADNDRNKDARSRNEWSNKNDVLSPIPTSLLPVTEVRTKCLNVIYLYQPKTISKNLTCTNLNIFLQKTV